MVNLASMVPQYKSKLVIMNNEAHCKQWRQQKLIRVLLFWRYNWLWKFVNKVSKQSSKLSKFPDFHKDNVHSQFSFAPTRWDAICATFFTCFTRVSREVRELIKAPNIRTTVKNDEITLLKSTKMRTKFFSFIITTLFVLTKLQQPSFLSSIPSFAQHVV